MIRHTRACCSWRHLLVRLSRGRRLVMLYPRWRLRSIEIGLRRIAINGALSAWMITRPLIPCSNLLIVLIGFIGIVFSNGLEGQALVLFVVNPSMGSLLLPDKVDHRQSKISRIIGRSAAHGDVAHHRLARDLAVAGTFFQAMLALLVLGRGDELPFFCITPHYSFDLRFSFSHFEKSICSVSFGMDINPIVTHTHFNVH